MQDNSDGQPSSIQGDAFTVIDLTADRASAAAALSVKHKLPMADGIIYAAALEFGATVWTQDADLKGLAQVKFFKKPA